MKKLAAICWVGLATVLGASGACSTRERDFGEAAGAGGSTSVGGAGTPTGGITASAGVQTEGGSGAAPGQQGGGAGVPSASGGPAGGVAGRPAPDCESGATQPCGKSTGNCEEGSRQCVSGSWGPCVGGVLPQAADSCMVGDDADCDGAKNEGCACDTGAAQPCGNCGMQQCGSDGKWGDCKNEGACAPGTTETRGVTCGNCGTQAQQRKCSDACGWNAWSDLGACGSQGECAIGSIKAATDLACGYCGQQSRKQTCGLTCTYGAAENSGTCAHANCPDHPGDERPGFVLCGGASCGMRCCVGSSNIVCQAAACSGSNLSTCDGPEDCPVGQYCAVDYPGAIGRGVCSATATATRWCHTDADCTATYPYCEDNRYPGGQFVGQCISTPPP